MILNPSQADEAFSINKTNKKNSFKLEDKSKERISRAC